MPEFLPDLPVDGILECLKRSPGHEIRSGKFDSPESSAALVANAFGWFLNRPLVLPPLPGVPAGQVETVTLEAEMRYPWKGGRQPWLDVGIETSTTLIGVESHRYEPFRPGKAQGFAELIDRPEWRETMGAYTRMRDDLVAGKVDFDAVDAVGLIKQAYGIHTRAQKRALGGVLVYLYAEPKSWASGKPVDPARVVQHQKEIAKFARMVAGDAVVFVPVRWRDLLNQWAALPALKPHVAALREKFGAL